MKPVMQTKFGPVEGNCFCACLASMLELPIEDIPFYHDVNWFKNYNDFLMTKGFTYVC